MDAVVDFEERAAFCALNRIFGFEPRKGLLLVEKCGGAANVFKAGSEAVAELMGSGCNEKYSSRIVNSSFDSASMELETLLDDGVRFVVYAERGYPPFLMECADPPLGIYYKGVSSPEKVFGSTEAAAGSGERTSRHCIAVVGTRNVSQYGRVWCGRIVESMSKTSVRPVIVSGLALGVDSVAHRTALENGLGTVAVMATGIDGIYPACHRALGEQIASSPGSALISDYPPDTKPVAINFIRRNRIIAGICKAAVLVESKIRGGGMITARLAGNYCRDVYALPGRVDDPYSQGCNMLIRQNLAAPIGDMADLMSQLGLGPAASGRKEMNFLEAVRNYYGSGTAKEELEAICSVAACIHRTRGISMDEICQMKRLSFGTVSNYVTRLECDGFINVDILQHCSACSEFL